MRDPLELFQLNKYHCFECTEIDNHLIRLSPDRLRLLTLEACIEPEVLLHSQSGRIKGLFWREKMDNY